MFLHVSHKENVKYGNLYISTNGIKFHLLKEYVIKDQTGFVDFENVKGQSGCFMINTYDKE